MSIERRKHPRISSRVRVEFIERERTESYTLNVSRNGIFIKGQTSRAENSLIRMKLFLPPDQREIEIFGRVAWHLPSGDMQGIGIQFLELNSDDRERWIKYTELVEQLDSGQLSEGSTPEASSDDPSEERRKTPRTDSSFLVRFKTKESLESFVTRNLSEGGMFLQTPVLKPVGTKIQIVMVHPDTGRDFEIEAEVARVTSEPTPEEPKGMGLEFVSLTEEQKESLKEFIEAKEEKT